MTSYHVISHFPNELKSNAAAKHLKYLEPNCLIRCHYIVYVGVYIYMYTPHLLIEELLINVMLISGQYSIHQTIYCSVLSMDVSRWYMINRYFSLDIMKVCIVRYISPKLFPFNYVLTVR